MKNLGYYNGVFDEIENMTIPMNDRVCYFGDGVYDATYSRNYKIAYLDEHVDRFYNSAALLQIRIAQTKEELKALLNDMVGKMDTGENFVYFQATRATDPLRNHVFKDDSEANIWINIFPKQIADIYRKISLITMEDTRFFHCNIKTLNLIPSVMAARKAKEEGCFETVLHRNGRVTECSHSNVHILKDGKLITAPTDNLILPGISRRHIIDVCREFGIPVEERPYMLEELMQADEVMISSVSTICMAAERIDGKPVGGKDPALLKKLQDKLLDNFLRRTQ